MDWLPPEAPPPELEGMDGMEEREPPLDPEEPLDEDEDELELGLEGMGMPLEDDDCCSTQPPIRNREIEPTSAVCTASDSRRLPGLWLGRLLGWPAFIALPSA